MAYISYKEKWESEFDNFVSRKDKVQVIIINQIKLEVHDSYKKDEKIRTNFEPVDIDDVINKAYLEEKLLKVDGHISLLEKNYNEFKILGEKQCIEKVLIQKAVKTTIQALYGKG